jgi:nanoRNase/pAp phosphatase (c-di-AMP/oligoRNAs hydrolase)
VDVREIAKGFGGGGHKLASGFTLTNKTDLKKVIELVK